MYIVHERFKLGPDTIKQVFSAPITCYYFSVTVSKTEVREECSSSKVAFMATATPRQSGLQEKQVLVFDHVVTNVGNGYDKSSGTFIAPVDGIYSFSTTVLTDNNVEIWGFIDVNESPKVWYNARGTDGRHDSGSQSLIIRLSKGDRVTVRNYANGGNIYGGHYTTFSGFMLFAV